MAPGYNVLRNGDGPAASSDVLRAEGLSTTFRAGPDEVVAVDDVSLTLGNRETLGIVGESGSGKSVLCRSLMGLLQGSSAKVSGSIEFGGEQLVGRSARDLRQIWGVEMAMVFQDPMTSLNPVVKIGRQITEVLRKRLGMSRRSAKTEALELLRAVGIPEPARRFDEYPHRLSGGMRQRIVIAVALAGRPRLLFADEPTTALDVTVAAQILDLLRMQQIERGMSMILVTHDLGVVTGRTDRTAVMYAGQIVEVAPTKELFGSMMRMPYTEALMNSIPRLEGSGQDRLRVIPGRPPDPSNVPSGCRFAPRCSYASDLCRREMPPMVSEVPGHAYRCWHPLPVVDATPTRVSVAGGR